MKVYEDTGITKTNNAHVKPHIDKLQLPKEKNAKVQKLAEEVLGVLQDKAMTATEMKSYQTHMQSLLVDWGVPLASACKQPDYQGIAKLLAAAVVSTEWLEDRATPIATFSSCGL